MRCGPTRETSDPSLGMAPEDLSHPRSPTETSSADGPWRHHPGVLLPTMRLPNSRQRDPVQQLTIGLIGLVVGVGLGVLGVLQIPQIDGQVVRDWAPPLSALVASLALLLSAYTYARTSRRARQAVTYEAWGSWNDATRQQRRQMHNKYPTFDEATAASLAALTSVPLKETATPEEHVMAEDSHKIGSYLTGLERIAVGCERGLYDLSELEKLGTKIIVSEWRIHQNFILAVRKARSHDKAFSALQNIAGVLSSKQPNA